MFSVAKTTAEIDAYNATGTANKTSTDPKAAQDKFLTMLVAQMSNQDPMNPLDNAEVTSQMAQINTVTGIQQLNTTMTSMAAQFGSLQAMQGVSLIGRTAMVEGNKPAVKEDVASGGFDLSSAVDDVKVDIVGKSGAILGSISMGPQQAGQQFFQVPLKGVDSAQVASFTVTPMLAGKPVEAKLVSLVPISGVSMQNGAMKLAGGDGKTYGYDQVLGYR
jgi:flagellar basal-body rod modification protein FlgD